MECKCQDTPFLNVFDSISSLVFRSHFSHTIRISKSWFFWRFSCAIKPMMHTLNTDDSCCFDFIAKFKKIKFTCFSPIHSRCLASTRTKNTNQWNGKQQYESFIFTFFSHQRTHVVTWKKKRRAVNARKTMCTLFERPTEKINARSSFRVCVCVCIYAQGDSDG